MPSLFSDPIVAEFFLNNVLYVLIFLHGICSICDHFLFELFSISIIISILVTEPIKILYYYIFIIDICIYIYMLYTRWSFEKRQSCHGKSSILQAILGF